MKKALYELDFKPTNNTEFEGWYKVYRGFILFIARASENHPYHASITVGEMEISIPLNVDDIWVVNFDGQNTKDD